MAHLNKYTKNSLPNIFAHCDRTQKNISNECVNREKSFLNYNLAPMENPNQRLKKRLSEIQVLKRKTLNVCCSWCVTLPKNFNNDSKKFFKDTYDFLCSRYGGEKNVISAWVHNDESQPHLHFIFVPVVFDKEKNVEKCSAKELLNLKDLKTFHTDYSNYMTKQFGYDVGVLNGATANGNLTIQELKFKNKEKQFAIYFEKLKKTYEEVKKEKQDFELEKQKKTKNYNERINALKQREDAIERSTRDFGGPPTHKTLESIKTYSNRVFEWWNSIKNKIQNFYIKLKNKEKSLFNKENELLKKENELKKLEDKLNNREENINKAVEIHTKQNLLKYQEYTENLKNENLTLKKYDIREISLENLKQHIEERQRKIRASSYSR